MLRAYSNYYNDEWPTERWGVFHGKLYETIEKAMEDFKKDTHIEFVLTNMDNTFPDMTLVFCEVPRVLWNTDAHPRHLKVVHTVSVKDLLGELKCQ